MWRCVSQIGPRRLREAALEALAMARRRAERRRLETERFGGTVKVGEERRHVDRRDDLRIAPARRAQAVDIGFRHLAERAAQFPDVVEEHAFVLWKVGIAVVAKDA